MNDLTPVLGFIGLGVMGSGMCANVVRKHGDQVHVFDLDAAALGAMTDIGAVGCTSVKGVSQAADILFLSLPGGRQVEAVADEIVASGRPGTVVVDLSTTGVAEARRVAVKLAERNMEFADAPVARTRQAAMAGTLSIMVGASARLFARIEPLLRYMGSDVTHCGDVGCGQVVKLVNNTLLFENVVSIAEMMIVAERAGVSAAKLVEAVGLGSGNSFALQNHGARAMAVRNFPEKAFPSDYVLKDLGYAIELAEAMGVEPRMAKLAAHYYRSAVEAGIGGKYFPAIIDLIGQNETGGSGHGEEPA